MEDLKISIGDPYKSGVYLVYVDHDFLDEFPDKEILIWHAGYWSRRMSDQKFRGKVHGWIGPLPTPRMTDLHALCVKYAIGALPDALHGGFLAGPYDSLHDAEDFLGDDGQYIIELHLDHNHKVIRKWSDKKMKWVGKRKKK